MRKNTLYILSLLVSFCFINGLANDVVIHSSTGNGLDQIYIENPRVTYDDVLCEFSVYFGSTGTIDLECVDATGTPFIIYMVSTILHATQPPTPTSPQATTPSPYTAPTA